MSTSTAVLIPVYKRLNQLSESEEALLKKVSAVLGNHDLFLGLHNDLLDQYKSYTDYELITFDSKYFGSKNRYNKLLATREFYKTFIQYDYLQIIQLDCWIFEDRLNEFCSLELDYIGAPWMENSLEGAPRKRLWKTGNGGFSLRKIDKFLSIIDQINCSPKGKIPVFKFPYRSIVQFLKNFGFRNNLKHYLKGAPAEDIFWSIYVPKVFSPEDFKIAEPSTAAHYSFEVRPSYLFSEVTGGKLPMGCHNWINNEPEFWASHISL